MSDNNSDFISFFAGMIIGSFVGVATALLLAPQSGEETRTLIHDKSIELKDKAIELGQDVQLRTGKVLDDGREQLDVMMEDFRNRLDELTKLVMREKERVNTISQEIKQDGAESESAVS
jgi:gas vesicle protein